MRYTPVPVPVACLQADLRWIIRARAIARLELKVASTVVCVDITFELLQYRGVSILLSKQRYTYRERVSPAP